MSHSDIFVIKDKISETDHDTISSYPHRGLGKCRRNNSIIVKQQQQIHKKSGSWGELSKDNWSNLTIKGK